MTGYHQIMVQCANRKELNAWWKLAKSKYERIYKIKQKKQRNGDTLYTLSIETSDYPRGIIRLRRKK